MAETGRVNNPEVRNFICAHVAKKLESNPTFVKVYGKDFAKKSLNANLLYAYTNEPKGTSTYAGYHTGYDSSITIVNVYDRNTLLTPEEILQDESIEETCVHEAIHALLERTKKECSRYGIDSGSGLLEHSYDKYGQTKELGRGLNEGFTEWMCEQLGYKSQAYPELTNFVRLISNFIGTEKTMELGKGGIFQRFPGILDMDAQSVATLLGIADDLYFQKDQISKLSGIVSALKGFNDDGRSEYSFFKPDYEAYLPEIERLKNIPDYALYIAQNHLENNEDSLAKFLDSILANRRENANVDCVRFESMILEKYFAKDMDRILNSTPMSKEDFERCAHIFNILNSAERDVPQSLYQQKPPYAVLEFRDKFRILREKQMTALDIAAGEQYKSGDFKVLEYISYLDKIYPDSYFIKKKHMENFVSQIAPKEFNNEIMDIMRSLANSKSEKEEERAALEKLTKTTIFKLKSSDPNRSVESGVIFSQDNFYSRYFNEGTRINKDYTGEVDFSFTLTQEEDYDSIMKQFDELRETIFNKTPDSQIHIASREIIVKNGNDYQFYTIDDGQIIPMEVDKSFDFHCELGNRIKDAPQSISLPQKTSPLSNMINNVRGKILSLFKGKNPRGADYRDQNHTSIDASPKEVYQEDQMSRYVQSTIIGKYAQTISKKEDKIEEKGIDEGR